MRASAASTALMTARPPCKCSSRTSSVVNERGAVCQVIRVRGKQSIGFGGDGHTAEEDGKCVVEKFG